MCTAEASQSCYLQESALQIMGPDRLPINGAREKHMGKRSKCTLILHNVQKINSPQMKTSECWKAIYVKSLEKKSGKIYSWNQLAKEILNQAKRPQTIQKFLKVLFEKKKKSFVWGH